MNHNLKQAAILILFSIFLLNNTKAQSYIYSHFNTGTGSTPGNSVTGTGTWAVPTTVPNFNYSISSSGNKIYEVLYDLDGNDELPETNNWETKYGEIDEFNTSCILVRHVANSTFDGAPLGTPITTTITFNSATSNHHWGFMVLDIDVDQVVIRAKDPSNNYYSNATVASWFKGAFDAATGTGESSHTGAYEPPCFDAANATVVGSEYVQSPCKTQSTLGSQNDYVGAGAYFEPNVPVKTLEFQFYNLQSTAGPSERYFIAAATLTSLPVNLVSFSSNSVSCNSQLSWETATEINVNHFEVQRSNDGINFSSIGVVGAKNSSTGSNYQYLDNNVNQDINYYRLMTVNDDGRKEYSKIIKQQRCHDNNIAIYPNPVTDFINIKGGKIGNTIQISNTLGQIVLSKVVTQFSESINVSNLQKGVYVVSVIDTNTKERKTYKFSKK
jgi:hypothetical protein